MNNNDPRVQADHLSHLQQKMCIQFSFLDTKLFRFPQSKRDSEHFRKFITYIIFCMLYIVVVFVCVCEKKFVKIEQKSKGTYVTNNSTGLEILKVGPL